MLRCVVMVLMLLPTLAAQGRVVILGVDGLDHALTETFMQAGDLPELTRLAAEGSFGPLLPTNPAQSPVSWASLTTGLNPGGTGIFGFLRRTLRDGQVVPELALAEPVETVMFGASFRVAVWVFLVVLVAFLVWLLRRNRRAAIAVGGLVLLIGGAGLLWAGAAFPESLVIPRNLRSGEGFWTVLDREGQGTCSLWAPCSFPAPNLIRGRLLSGLGVPDLAGTMGQVAVFRDEPVPDGLRLTSMGGREVQLRRVEGTERLEGASIPGPKSPFDGQHVRVPVSASPSRSRTWISCRARSRTSSPSDSRSAR